jgi:succinate-semialdehyde dehydrogenase/glutarate-semialdehyde dehydrogenase
MDIRELEIFKSSAYINGIWVDSTGGSSIEVFNPFDNSLIGTIPALTNEQVHDAIQSASEAQMRWKKQTIKYRSDLLKNGLS